MGLQKMGELHLTAKMDCIKMTNMALTIGKAYEQQQDVVEQLLEQLRRANKLVEKQSARIDEINAENEVKLQRANELFEQQSAQMNDTQAENDQLKTEVLALERQLQTTNQLMEQQTTQAEDTRACQLCCLPYNNDERTASTANCCHVYRKQCLEVNIENGNGCPMC